MKVYVVRKTTKKGLIKEYEAYYAKSKAVDSVARHNRFAWQKGDKYEVVEREVADGTVLGPCG